MSAAAPPAAAATDRCPRCGGGFHCGIADAGPCACTGVHLDSATLAALRARYRRCLCLECLMALAAGADPDPPAAAQTP